MLNTRVDGCRDGCLYLNSRGTVIRFVDRRRNRRHAAQQARTCIDICTDGWLFEELDVFFISNHLPLRLRLTITQCRLIFTP